MRLIAIGVVGIVVASLGLVALAPPARANGLMITATAGAPEPTGRGAGRGPVRLTDHRVQATIRDRVAEVVVEQVFESDADVQLEGTYLFPLPDGATVSKFAMTMGGKMVEGEVLDARQARDIYESIVRRRRDPGLLEYVGRGLFRAHVFPIEPRSRLTIRLAFEQVVPEDAGTLEFRYPLATNRLHGEPVDRVLVDVRVESDVDVKALWCPSHPVLTTRDGERKARVTYERAGRVQDKDFVLYVGRSPEAVGFSLVSWKQAAEDGTFMAAIAPRNRVEASDALAKDIVYVVDVSGSMAGEKIEQAKKALAVGVGMLGPKDRFGVIAFSTGVRSFREGLVAADAETKRAAVAWIDALQAAGGTNIEGALLEALYPAKAEGRLPLVVFLTDGRPTVGATAAEGILATVKGANSAKARVFTFGVGSDLDVALLDRIAEATGGARDYVAEGEDIEISTGRFFTKVDRPVMTDVKVEFGSGVYDAYPNRLPDLFAGSQVVIFGRYREAGDRTIRLRGMLAGREVVAEYKGTLRAADGAAFLPRLWAQRKVAYLLDEIRLHGADKELVDEVTRLGTKYGIVTPYTSALVVEDVRADGRTVSGRPAPAGGGAGDGRGKLHGPGGVIPPGLREPTDAPPPPEAAATSPSDPTTPTPAPTMPPAAKTETERSRDLRKDKERAGEDGSDPTGRRVASAAGKTFVLGVDGRWIDTAYDGKKETVKVEAFSAAYFDLLAKGESVSKFLGVGERVVFVLGAAGAEVLYEIVPPPAPPGGGK